MQSFGAESIRADASLYRRLEQSKNSLSSSGPKISFLILIGSL
jgi:hypothetical protein